MKTTLFGRAALAACCLLWHGNASQARDNAPLLETIVVPLAQIEPLPDAAPPVPPSPTPNATPTPSVPDPVMDKRVRVLSQRVAEHLDGLILKQHAEGHKVTRQVSRVPVAGAGFLIVTAQVQMPLSTPAEVFFKRTRQSNPFAVARVEVRCPDGQLLAAATQELEGKRVSVSKYERHNRYRTSGMTNLLETFGEKALDGAFAKSERETSWNDITARAARCSQATGPREKKQP